MGAANVWQCRDDSDSGPDSGSSDNCRWEVNGFGQSFSITPLQGEFSFEGGGDWTDVQANRTKIFLTEIDGIYDCGDTVDASNTAISCSVTRLDPDDGVACTPVPYVFRTNGGTCTLTVNPQGQQLVANLFVSYQPEAAEGDSDRGGYWPAALLSKVSFATSSTVFSIPACRGFTIDDGFTGPSAFPETPGDWIPSTDDVEFACAFQRSEVFETNDEGDLETWISEGIQFWGDISFSRGGVSN